MSLLYRTWGALTLCCYGPPPHLLEDLQEPAFLFSKFNSEFICIMFQLQAIQMAQAKHSTKISDRLSALKEDVRVQQLLQALRASV